MPSPDVLSALGLESYAHSLAWRSGPGPLARRVAEGEEPDAKLVATLVRDEVARRIAQVYCLERLAAGDSATARLVLSALAQVRRSCVRGSRTKAWGDQMERPSCRKRSS